VPAAHTVQDVQLAPVRQNQLAHVTQVWFSALVHVTA